MTVVRFKNLNVGRSRPSNKFKTHSIGNENLGYNKEDTWLSILARTCPRKSVVRQWIPRSRVGSWTAPSLARTNRYMCSAAHDRFIDTNKPPIGKVEHLGLDGPHGTIPIRCYHPSRPGIAEGAALVYLHGGGYIVGLLDQFDTAMRLFAENSGAQAQVYAVD
jgi:acetyl esterase/lipase